MFRSFVKAAKHISHPIELGTVAFINFFTVNEILQKYYFLFASSGVGGDNDYVSSRVKKMR